MPDLKNAECPNYSLVELVGYMVLIVPVALTIRGLVKLGVVNRA
jgi:hypothetical protein